MRAIVQLFGRPVAECVCVYVCLCYSGNWLLKIHTRTCIMFGACIDIDHAISIGCCVQNNMNYHALPYSTDVCLSTQQSYTNWCKIVQRIQKYSPQFCSKNKCVRCVVTFLRCEHEDEYQWSTNWLYYQNKTRKINPPFPPFLVCVHTFDVILIRSWWWWLIAVNLIAMQ